MKNVGIAFINLSVNELFFCPYGLKFPMVNTLKYFDKLSLVDAYDSPTTAL